MANAVCAPYKQSMLTNAANLPDLTGGNLKLMILSGALFNENTTEFISTVSANQVATGTEYTGPITLGNVTVSSSGNNRIVDWDDILIAQDAGAGFNDATHAAAFNDTGVEATSRVVFLWDFGGTFNNDAAPLALNTPNNVFQI